MNQLAGSCNCGDIQYEVTGLVKKVLNCHCNLCRKMNGAAFSTYAVVLASDFNLLAGQLKHHQVSENATKHFCGKCGTPVYNSNPKFAGLNILHIGSLDCVLDRVPEVNIYCDSKLAWLDAVNDIPQMSEGLT